MDHNRSQECVRDMRCILHNVPAGDVEVGVEGKRADNARRGRVRRIVDLHLIRCSQRVSLHRTSLVRQT